MDKTSEAYAKKLLAEMGSIKTAIAGTGLPCHPHAIQTDPQDNCTANGQSQSESDPLGNPIASHGKPSESKCKKTPKGKCEKFREFLTTHKPILELIGLFFIIGYTTVAALQWRTSVDVARKQLRAFLSVQKVYISDGGDDGVSIVSVNIHNSGATPARNVVVRRAVVSMNAVAGSTITGQWPVVVHQTDEPMGLMAPQYTNDYVTPIKPNVMAALRNHLIYIEISGDIEYVDIFGESRVTGFCQMDQIAQGVKGQPQDFSFGGCDHHNCDDENCAADK